MVRLTRGGFVLVLILALLPLNGTVCAALCSAPAAAATAPEDHDSSHHHASNHHASGTRSHHARSSPAESRFERLAGHNCGGHAAIGEATLALTAGRADIIGHVGQSFVPFTAVGLDRALTGTRPTDDPPLGIGSPTRAPLVLRI
jgi:hypothetical protein